MVVAAFCALRVTSINRSAFIATGNIALLCRRGMTWRMPCIHDQPCSTMSFGARAGV